MTTQTTNTYAAVIDSPIGRLGIKIFANHITHIDFVDDTESLRLPTEALAVETVKQLQQYFANPKHIFTLPLKTQGTDHQTRVWQVLQQTFPGDTLSYGQMAKHISSSPRAIGGACRRNPIPIIIPCHRIVGANHLGGYSGDTQGRLLNIKAWLLKHENALTTK